MSRQGDLGKTKYFGFLTLFCFIYFSYFILVSSLKGMYLLIQVDRRSY